MPVSGLAAGAYLAMLVASLFIGPATAAPVRRLAWGAMLVLVGAAAGSAVWFTIVQKWIIGAFCPYCMTTHITGLLLAALVIWRAPRQFDDDSTDVAMTNPAPMPDVGTAATVQVVSPAAPRRVIGPLPAIGLALVGLVLAGILAACQVVFTPPAVYRGGESQDNLPAIDPHAVPLVGSPDALYVVTLLFDYKCPHCQQMHFMLDEAIRRYGGKLAFALCPAPLNSQCNPYIPRDVDEYQGLLRTGQSWPGGLGGQAQRRFLPSTAGCSRWSPATAGAREASTPPGPKLSNWSARQSSMPPGPIPGSTGICKPPFGFTAKPAAKPSPNWFSARVGSSPNRMTQTTLL